MDSGSEYAPLETTDKVEAPEPENEPEPEPESESVPAPEPEPEPAPDLRLTTPEPEPEPEPSAKELQETIAQLQMELDVARTPRPAAAGVHRGSLVSGVGTSAPLEGDEAAGGELGTAATRIQAVYRGKASRRRLMRKVLATVTATRTMSGWMDLTSQAAVARRMKKDAADAAEAAAPRSRQALRQARAVSQDGGITLGGAGFVPNGQGKESLALSVGAGSTRLVLHDAQTLLETGVAISTDGEWIYGFHMSPDRRDACGGIGLDGKARLVVFEVSRGPPWHERWTEHKGNPVIDAVFSADGSVVACVVQTVQHVHLHDAESGSVLHKVPFGVTSELDPAMNFCFTLQFTADFLIVSGGFKTEDEKKVGVWRLADLAVNDNELLLSKQLETAGDKKMMLPETETVVVAEDKPTKLLVYDGIVGPVATCETHVCVGTADGSVTLHEIQTAGHGGCKEVQDRRIRLAEPMESAKGKTAVVAVTFSQNGDMLAAAWATGDVVVYDTRSTARLAKFFQDDCTGLWDMYVLAFSGDGSRLVMGGGLCDTVSVHQLTPQRPQRFSISGSKDNLSSAAVSAKHVALVCGSHVVVQLHDGAEVADINTGEAISSNCQISPVQLRPSGDHVAVLLGNKILEVYSFDVPKGKRVFRKENLDGMLCGVRYSPDGSQLLVSALGAGVYVFDAQTLQQTRALTSKPDYEMVWDAMVDPVTKRIVCANWGGDGGLNMTDSETGEKVGSFDQDLVEIYGAKFQWPVVDAAGQRLAYLRVDATGGSATVVRSLGEEGECLATFKGDEKKLVGPKGFNGDWLLCCEFEMEDTASSDVTLVDVQNPGAEKELNKLLSMVLGAGFTAHCSVGWVPGTKHPTIHASVGSELVFVNLQHLETLQADGCVHASLLMDLCGDKAGGYYQPEGIDAIVERFPDCINVPKQTLSSDGTLRNAMIGDTVLHYCARECRTEAVKRLLLSEKGIYTPVSSGSHVVMLGKKKHVCEWTALHEAIDRSNKDMTLHLLGTLNTSMNFVTAELIADVVYLMSYKMPYLVPEALKQLDDRLVRKESTIETRIHAQRDAFVSGRDELIDTSRQTSGPGDQPKPEAIESDLAARKEYESLLTAVESEAEPVKSDLVETWGTDLAGNPILPSKQKGNRTAQVDIKVIQIANLVGPPDRSPFAAMVGKCDFTICESKIMKAAIDFKWQRIRWWVCADLAYYMISLFVASATMIDSAWTAHNVADGSLSDADSSTSKALFVVMIVLEALLLVLEVLEMIVHRHRWLNTYNIINVTSILLLLTPAAVYQVANSLHVGDIAWQRFSTVLLQNLGSIGLGLKWLGLLGYLDSFQDFSKIIKMTSQITKDISCYLIVYGVLILALVAFCIVDMPSNPAFANSSTIADGVLSSMFLAWQTSVMGAFEVGDYNTVLAKLVFVMFTGFGNLIMLNLLIAVMGDSFEKVKADEAPHAMFEQADTIVEYERLLTYRWFRSFSIWDPQDEKKFPRYIVIAEEAETQGEEAADGITGRMRKHLNVSTDTVGKRVDALEEEMKRQHNETKQQHEEDKKRQQEETKRQHEEMKQQHKETKRQHEEMKSLLATLLSRTTEKK